MKDQAESLRLKLMNIKNNKTTKVIAVVSGKGGVGKSNLSLNFALALSQQGKRVLLFDMDIGMGNINILMGLSPKFTIVDLFESNIGIREIIEEGPNQISYISGGTGFSKIFNFGIEKVNFFIDQLDSLIGEYEYVLFDMGAGVTQDSLQISLAADELFVVTTPEPTSITDAYATMKFFSLKEKEIPIYLLINRVHSEKQAKLTVQRLSKAVKQFLNKDLLYLGDIPDDVTVAHAVNRQIPFLLLEPNAHVSRALYKIVERYENQRFDQKEATSSFGFIMRLKQLFQER
jgi:flagellar biosynthesis protein FlhG